MVVLLLFAGCGPPSDPEAAAALLCEVVSDTSLGPDERTPGGWTAAAAMALATPYDGPLRWTAHPESTIRVTPLPDVATARFLDLELVAEADGVVPTLGCADTVVVAGTLDVTSDDGFLAEHWPASFTSVTGSTTATVVTVDPGELAGTFVVTEVDPDAADGAALRVNPVWTTTAASGAILLGPDDSASYVSVARW